MTVRSIWIIAGIVAIVGVVLFMLGSGGDLPRWQVAVSDALPAMCSLLAMLAFGSATAQLKQWDATKLAWSGFAVSMALCFAAEFGWFVMEAALGYHMDELYPSFLDGIWIASYIPLIAGLSVTIIRYHRSGMGFGSPVFYLGLVGGFAVIVVLVGQFLLLPIARDAESSATYKIVALAYPVLDLPLLLLALTVTHICRLFAGGSVARPWQYVALGLVFWSTSDIAYAYLDWVGLYHAGHMTDLGWNLAYLFLAIGALEQRNLLRSLHTEEGAGHA